MRTLTPGGAAVAAGTLGLMLLFATVVIAVVEPHEALRAMLAMVVWIAVVWNAIADVDARDGSPDKQLGRPLAALAAATLGIGLAGTGSPLVAWLLVGGAVGLSAITLATGSTEVSAGDRGRVHRRLAAHAARWIAGAGRALDRGLDRAPVSERWSARARPVLQDVVARLDRSLRARM